MYFIMCVLLFFSPLNIALNKYVHNKLESCLFFQKLLGHKYENWLNDLTDASMHVDFDTRNNDSGLS